MTATPDDPLMPDEPQPNPETDPEGRPQPDPEVTEGDDTEPGQMPDHDTDVGA